MWLIVINAHSKWPEVIAMTSTTAEKTVHTLRSRYGIPDQIVMDNGPLASIMQTLLCNA